MNNIVGSLVESYIYADMYNREYDGGADILDKVYVGGVPVENILPSIENDGSQDGGNKQNESVGPFANKVVPTGLIFIQIRKDSDVEYEDHIHPGINREVISESLYDRLIGTILVGKTTHKNRTKKEKTRKRK